MILTEQVIKERQIYLALLIINAGSPARHLVHVGFIETLLDDTNELAKRAEAAGVQVEVDVWDDMPHVWHHFAPILPEARQAIGRIGEFMKKHTG